MDGADGTDRYTQFLDMTTEQLSDIYDLELDRYSDKEKYMKDNKEKILTAIENDKKESA